MNLHDVRNACFAFRLQPQKEKKCFLNFWDFDLANFSFEKKKISCQPQKCELELCMSNGSKVLIYLSFLLKEAVF